MAKPPKLSSALHTCDYTIAFPGVSRVWTAPFLISRDGAIFVERKPPALRSERRKFIDGGGIFC